eukprot:4249834-Pleurochrysis_carterae.AAC.2
MEDAAATIGDGVVVGFGVAGVSLLGAYKSGNVFHMKNDMSAEAGLERTARGGGIIFVVEQTSLPCIVLVEDHTNGVEVKATRDVVRLMLISSACSSLKEV